MNFYGYNIKLYNDDINISDQVIKRGKLSYIKDYIALDTETSHTELVYDKKGKLIKDKVEGWIYQWAFATASDLVNGRTPSQLVEAIDNIIEKLEVNKEKRLVVYVHNLGYDNTYLMPFFIDVYGLPKIIANDKRKVISLTFENGLVFKCSYKLSNKSLEKWGKDLGVKHQKAVGLVDYDLRRYQNSKLDYSDYKYQWLDVISMRECLDKQFKLYHDNVASVPLTSTGYVRREVYKSYKAFNDKNHGRARRDFAETKLTPVLYDYIKTEIAGGITHGNRHLAGKTVRVSDKYPYIKHRDFESHYPTQQKIRTFPIGRFIPYKLEGEPFKISHDEIMHLSRNRCLLMRVLIKDMELRSNHITLPYAQFSKFEAGRFMDTSFIVDNGRVLKMSGASEVVINEIDYKWLRKQYRFKMEVVELYISKRGMLPKYLIDVVDRLYADKTNLKNKIKEVKEMGASESELFELELNLLIVKQLLNGIYGMSATDPVKDEFIVDELGGWDMVSNHIEESKVQELLDKYYKGAKNNMRYQFGAWTTAWARDELMYFYEEITRAGGVFLYADTDSIFYLSNDEVESYINFINDKLRQEADKKGFYTFLSDGSKHYYNRFDDEKDDIRAFRFLHAKAYAVETGDSHKLSCTIAGVPKRVLTKDGYYYREQELGSISELRKDKSFTICGGLACTYKERPITTLYIEGHKTELSSSAILFRTTKTLSDMDVWDI